MQCEDEGMAELIFEVTQENDGGYCAWDDLRSNVREAVRAYFFACLLEGPSPERVRLHLVRDEVFAPV